MPDGTPTRTLPSVPTPPAGAYRGTDPSGTITVELDTDAGQATLRLHPGWRDHVELRGLESGIVAAFTGAAAARLLAWATTPARHTPQRRRTQPPASRSSAPPPSLTVPAPDAHAATSTRTTPPASMRRVQASDARTDEAPDETSDKIVAAVTAARRRLDASTPAVMASWTTPITVTSSDDHVRVTVRTGRLTAVHLDQAWAAEVDDTTLTAAVGDGLTAALRPLTSFADPPPELAADLEDVLARALAASRVPARPPTPPPATPPAPDSAGWMDRVAQAFSRLHTDDTPWRPRAAAHLRQTADTLARQSPRPAAYSFGGAAVASAYDAIHQQTLALLRDAAHSFTEAAAGPTPAPAYAATASGPDSPAPTATSALQELSDSARNGLNACAIYLETVSIGIDTHLSQYCAGSAVAIRDDLTDVAHLFGRRRSELDRVFTAVGDPDALNATAHTWLHLLDDHVSTLTAIVTPAGDSTGPTRITAGADTNLDILAAQAAAAAVLDSIGDGVHTSLATVTDAIKIFWATLAAAISTAEAVLAVAAILACNLLGAPAALLLAVTATWQLAGMTTLSGLPLAMADSDAAAHLTALTRRLTSYTALRLHE